CGTRGWTLPQHPDFTPEDEKLLARERVRLELSLAAARAAGVRPAIAMMHYPPAPESGAPTPFTELLEAYGVSLCVYGHLHGDAARSALGGVHRGVRYRLVACDAIGFEPVLVARIDDEGRLTL